MSAPTLNLDVTHAPQWATKSPRLQLKPDHGSTGLVQGGWWPLTKKLYVELPHLLTALLSRPGPVERVTYDENSWASVSLRMEYRGHSVILEPSNTSPNALTLSGKEFGKLTLLVVPRDTDPVAAYTAVMAAADPDNVSTPEELLEVGMRAAQEARQHRRRAGGMTPHLAGHRSGRAARRAQRSAHRAPTRPGRFSSTSLRGHARSRGDIVGSAQPGTGYLYQFSNRSAAGAGHH